MTTSEQEELPGWLFEELGIEVTDDCWVATRHIDNRGYAALYFKGRYKRISRVVLALQRGESLGQLHALHHCDNPPCVRPSHLFAGTHQDNMTDASKKGKFRGPRVVNQQMYVRILRSPESSRKVGQELGISYKTVQRVRRGDFDGDFLSTDLG